MWISFVGFSLSIMGRFSSFLENFTFVGLCIVDKLEVVSSRFMGQSCSGRVMLVGVVNSC